jgi:formamidopyrimidine-DNA glycosylase
MPELAEVEVARRHLERWWSQRAAEQVLLYAPPRLKAGDADELDDLLKHPLAAIKRRGKQLIATFTDDDRTLLIHFKLTGKITRGDTPKPKDVQLAWLLPETGWLRLQDSRRLSELHVLTPAQLAAYPPLVNMGPEPHDLRDADHLRQRLGRGKKRLKDTLLDQATIAGVGNIAISELFWRLKIPPELPTNELTDEQVAALYQEMPIYFDALIASSEHIEDFVYLSEGAEENPFDAYDREGLPCNRCQTPIARATFGGRSTYYCPTCQVPKNS